MARNKGHRAGGKFAGSHTTIIVEAEPVLDAAENDPAVTKIVLGPIQSKGKGAGSPRRVKCTPLRDGVCGFEVVVTKGGATQRFYLYVSEDRYLRNLQENLEGFSKKKAGKRGKKVRGRRKKNHVTANNWGNDP